MISAGIHEIVLIVKDVRKAEAFYCDLLGLQPLVETTDDWAQLATISPSNPQWLGLTKGPLLFEEFSPRPAGSRFGPVHFAFRGNGTPEAFLEVAERLGVTVHGPIDFKGRMAGRSYYFYDPDDNLGEIWFPSPS